MTARNFDRALEALRFFALPISDQIAFERRNITGHEPTFFSGKSSEDTGSDFFFGVACVFKTYMSALYDQFSSESEADRLVDFNHRLDVAMCGATASDWSERAVEESELWRRLRSDAAEALRDFRGYVPALDSKFEIAALVNASDFISNSEVKSLLGE